MSSMKYLTAYELRTIGILQEVNRTFFHPLGLAAEVDLETGSLRIQDHRHDMEGVIYGPSVMEAEKFRIFTAFCKEQHARRMAALGFVIQVPPVQDAVPPPVLQSGLPVHLL